MKLLREKCFIDGAWVGSDDTIAVLDPYDQSVLGTVPALSANQASKAIAAAREASASWGATTAATRASILRKMHGWVLENLEPLAQLVTAESGKPIKESRGEVRYSASFLSWFAGEAERAYGRIVPASRAGRQIQVVMQPVGPCAVITPWNFPSAMIARKVAPAIAAGCTVVCKPAEITPYSGLVWGVIAEECGLPRGVLNIVTGDPVSIGRTLTGSPIIRKVTFTGSTKVGKLLMADSAATMKRVSFELGGNAPFIVCNDASVDAAVEHAMAAKFRNAGQTCVAANRFFIHEDCHDEFVTKMVAATSKLTVGSGHEEATDVGPLINKQGAAKVRRLLSAAVDAGAEVVGGIIPENGATLIGPVVATGVTNEMPLAREEIFGPVVAIQKFADVDDVIQKANDTNYGLAAYACTHNQERIAKFSAELEYGMVGFNTGLMSTAEAPFGGLKESGLGREGGQEGIGEYLSAKYVCLQ